MESILIVLWVKEQAKPIKRNGWHESLLLNRSFFFRSVNQKQSKWRKRTLLLLCPFEIESPINQPHCLPLKEVALMKFWEYYTWLYLIILYQCTMHPAMSIDILEVKIKNKLRAHFRLIFLLTFWSIFRVHSAMWLNFPSYPGVYQIIKSYQFFLLKSMNVYLYIFEIDECIWWMYVYTFLQQNCRF